MRAPPIPVDLDLRSDAVTRPTDAMWEAMRAARLGWGAVGDDPQVQRLEAIGAALTGKEGSLLVPTGTMANLLALMTHTERGDQVVLDDQSHILWSEEWGLGYVCGVIPRAIRMASAAVDPLAVGEAIGERRTTHHPKTSLVCLENTHTFTGGTVTGVELTAALCDAAHAGAAAVHVDGARIVNAATALRVTIAELVHEADTVALGLNKGLSVPGGALLCGPAGFLKSARVHAKRLGGGSWHQAGITAAAGIVALESMLPTIQRDHVLAGRLAAALRSVPGIEIWPAAPQTNIVMASIDPAASSAAAVVDGLRGRGIGATIYQEQVVRFVTHRHVTVDGVDVVVEAIRGHMAVQADRARTGVPRVTDTFE